ncbi:MAG: DnaJ domain-containing protein [Gemmatimonadota bacterium]
MSEERFIDHYEVLQVSCNADAETIERVFRLLAKRYHPDNASTGDSERFLALSEAHRVLSDPHERARYDARYESGKSSQWSLFFEAPLGGVDEDQRIQQWILSVLYQARRRSSSEPGVGIYELENYLEMAEGQLDYHLWYLKEKGWLMRTPAGAWAITVDGIDWITERDHLFRKERLLPESVRSKPFHGPARSSTEEDHESSSAPPQSFPRKESVA